MSVDQSGMDAVMLDVTVPTYFPLSTRYANILQFDSAYTLDLDKY